MTFQTRFRYFVFYEKSNCYIYQPSGWLHEMSGQMKVLIDRMNAMYSLDYQFRDVYMLTTAADNEPDVPTRAIAGLTGWIDCYPKSRLAGTVFCGGVDAPRTIVGNAKLQEAYALGKRV